MLIKATIMAVIVLAGGVFFANEITQFLPTTSTNFLDFLKDDLGKIKDDTVQNAETRVEGTVVTVTKEVNELQEKSAELLSKSAKEVTDSTQKGIKEITDSTQKGIKEITDSTQNTFFGRGSGGGGGGGGNPQTTSNNQNGNPQTTSNNQNDNSNEEFNEETGRVKTQGSLFDRTGLSRTKISQDIVSFETLSLTTNQQSNGNVVLQYEDTSGKTNSVTVTLRTTERELFSGIFYSSSFEAFVNDASNTAYFIDMVIEHQELGMISSSVYNPRDSPGTIINGVFSKS